MKLGVMTVALGTMDVDDVFKYLSGLGVQAVELCSGGYVGNDHANPNQLLNDERRIQDLKDRVSNYNLEISALSCHGNPVHPQKEIADKFHDDFEKTVMLAEKLGIERVITFSGCPGDSPDSMYPNWVTCPWPDVFLTILDYQWNDVLFPYWEKAVAFSKNHGVNKICLEMHPGFCVYNPETLLKLRSGIGVLSQTGF